MIFYKKATLMEAKHSILDSFGDQRLSREALVPGFTFTRLT